MKSKKNIFKLNQKQLEHLVIVLVIIFLISLGGMLFYLHTQDNKPSPSNIVKIDDITLNITLNGDLKKINRTHYSDIKNGEDVEVYHNVSNLNSWVYCHKLDGYNFDKNSNINNYNVYSFFDEEGANTEGQNLDHAVVIFYNPNNKVLIKLETNTDEGILDYVINIY